MSRKFTFILIISLVFILSIGAISATDSNSDNTTVSEYDTIDTSTQTVDSESTLTYENTDDEVLSSDENSSSSDLEISDDDTLSASEENSTVGTVISTNNTKILKTENFSISLTDDEGNVLSNQSVIFNINNKNYTRTTNDEGIASFKISLAPNSYE